MKANSHINEAVCDDLLVF